MLKKTCSIATLVALSIGLAGSGFAQGRDGPGRGHDRDRGQERERDRAGHDRQMHRGGPAPGARTAPWRDHRPGPPPRDLRRDGRGAGPEHNFYRGGRLPPVYRSRQYVVDDWRRHRLSPPPRGYHWVQAGADYLLVAIATGVILQILLSN